VQGLGVLGGKKAMGEEAEKARKQYFYHRAKKTGAGENSYGEELTGRNRAQRKQSG